MFKRLTKIISIVLTWILLMPQAKAYNFAKQTGLSDLGGAAGYDPEKQSVNNFISTQLGLLIRALLGLLGVIFLLLMLYGGYKWMMARGNEEEVKKAVTVIRNSIIGLIIVVSAYAITYFVGQYFI